MEGLPWVIYDTHRVRLSPRTKRIDEMSAMTLFAVQFANVAGEEASQVLNIIDFSDMT